MDEEIEKLRADLVELKSANESLTSEINRLNESVSEKDKRIESLSEYNNRLFQKVTVPVEAKPVEQVKTSDDYAKQIVENLLKTNRRRF